MSTPRVSTPSPQPLHNLPTRLALTAFAAMAAEASTFPLDTLKTRLQLQRNSLQSRPSTKLPPLSTRFMFSYSGESVPSSRPLGAFRTAFSILRKEGVQGLYQGLTPALARHVVYTSIRITLYEQARMKGQFQSTNSNPGKKMSVAYTALLGGTAGMIGQLVASPLDLVKVRMQAGQGSNPGGPKRSSGVAHALQQIAKQEGVAGLYRGVVPNMQRAFLVNMGELTCYDEAKHFIVSQELLPDNVAAHTIASVMSGFVASLLSCPADVIKTRMMSQVACGKAVGRAIVRNTVVVGVREECSKRDVFPKKVFLDVSTRSGAEVNGTRLRHKEVPRIEAVMYRNSVHCLVHVVKTEGVRALWKGFWPTWARLGPWQFVFWVSYEEFRRLAGLKSF